MTDDERDEYFHRVEVTSAMTEALQSEIAAHNGQNWSIDFNPVFQFHIVDRSHGKISRDYGWYPDWQAMIEKMQRLLPDLVLDKLLTN